MDFHRADWSEFSDVDDCAWEPACDIELPAEAIGQDERRMQQRAHAAWSTLRQNASFPPIAALDLAALGDFSAHAVLLDFSAGIENPAIAFLGADLAMECGDTGQIRRLSDIPGTSLLSRIADHYVQILAYQAPAGFEAEFVNPDGATTLYRGMLLPFGDADGVISHVLGIINWREFAGADIAASLLAEIRQAYGPEAIDAEPAPQPARIDLLMAPLLAAAQPVVATPDLADWLISARSMARMARLRDDSGHVALYAALGAAWDFALAARNNPAGFARLLAEAGLNARSRRALLPLVTLVFGPATDRARLAEYAAVLAHAERLDMAPGTLAGWLAATPGGLAGAARAERDAQPSDAPRQTRHARLAQRLRRIQTRPLSSLDANGPEFSVVLTRRLPTGEIVLLGEAGADEALLARMARHLPG